MASFADIPIIIQSLKDAKSIADAIRQLDKKVAIDEKASELFNIIIDLQSHVSSLQSDLMLIQTQHGELLQTKSNLEKELVQMKNWDITKSKYKLISVTAGNVVYESQDTSETKHWLCTNCYEKQQKSILQSKHPKGSMGAAREVFCPACNMSFHINVMLLPNFNEKI